MFEKNGVDGGAMKRRKMLERKRKKWKRPQEV